MTEEEKQLVKDFLDGNHHYVESLREYFGSCVLCGMKADSMEKLAEIIKKYMPINQD